MIIRQRSLWFIPLVSLLWLAWVPPVTAIDAQSQRLEREFQAAVAQYDSGQFARSRRNGWRTWCARLPQSFEIHELLGLVYSAQSQDAKASPHLEEAVRLKPDSASARTNLAANLMRLGKLGTGRRGIQEGS